MAHERDLSIGFTVLAIHFTDYHKHNIKRGHKIIAIYISGGYNFYFRRINPTLVQLTAHEYCHRNLFSG